MWATTLTLRRLFARFPLEAAKEIIRMIITRAMNFFWCTLMNLRIIERCLSQTRAKVTRFSRAALGSGF